MKEPSRHTGEEDADPRQRVIEEMDAAMVRLSKDMAHADAGLMLRLGIGYCAEMYARHLGYSAAIEALTGIARRGVRLASAACCTKQAAPELRPKPNQSFRYDKAANHRKSLTTDSVSPNDENEAFASALDVNWFRA